jgi:BASS family bile acid:Na+ symporter
MNNVDLINILVNVALAVIMFGIGLSLTINDFKNLFKLPKPIFVGFLTQIFVLPILSFSIAYFSNLSPEMKVGIIIIAICPVGTSSNLIVHLFKGNVALSVSLTLINSLISPLTIPFITNLGLYIFLHQHSEISISILDSIVQLGLNVLLPAALGITIRHFFSDFAKRSEKPLKFILPIILALVFTLKIFFGGNDKNSSLSISEILNILPYVLSLNILGMFAGYYIAGITRLQLKNRITIAIEVGLHNTALALVVAGTLLKNYEMQKPILVYAMFTFFTALIFAWYFSRGLKQQMPLP